MRPRVQTLYNRAYYTHGPCNKCCSKYFAFSRQLSHLLLSVYWPPPLPLSPTLARLETRRGIRREHRSMTSFTPLVEYAFGVSRSVGYHRETDRRTSVCGTAEVVFPRHRRPNNTVCSFAYSFQRRKMPLVRETSENYFPKFKTHIITYIILK